MIPLAEQKILKLLPKNAGMHNSIYRGEDITDLFYNGTLSKQIEAGTFDDIFIGDYIIGKVSKRKYLVADLDYRLHTGDTETIKHHILMIPEKTMQNKSMNTSSSTTGAYIESEMYKTHLKECREIIKNDFETGHILKHKEYFQNTVTKTHHSSGTNTTIPNLNTIDKSQLSLFRLKPDLIIALNDLGARQGYWLRDVISSTNFCVVSTYGTAYNSSASLAGGIRPAFLVY